MRFPVKLGCMGVLLAAATLLTPAVLPSDAQASDLVLPRQNDRPYLEQNPGGWPQWQADVLDYRDSRDGPGLVRLPVGAPPAPEDFRTSEVLLPQPDSIPLPEYEYAVAPNDPPDDREEPRVFPAADPAPDGSPGFMDGPVYPADPPQPARNPRVERALAACVDERMRRPAIQARLERMDARERRRFTESTRREFQQDCRREVEARAARPGTQARGGGTRADDTRALEACVQRALNRPEYRQALALRSSDPQRRAQSMESDRREFEQDCRRQLARDGGNPRQAVSERELQQARERVAQEMAERERMRRLAVQRDMDAAFAEAQRQAALLGGGAQTQPRPRVETPRNRERTQDRRASQFEDR